MKTKIHFNVLIMLLIFGIGHVNYMEAQTDLNIQTNYQGYSRSFRVHVPQGYEPSQPIPVVLVFHAGGISNSLEIMTRTRFHLIGDTANFITIFPQALLGFWADSRGNPADVAGIDDVGFTNYILDTLESLYNIDAERIYAAGMSTGGVLCQRLALQSNTRIAAYASVGASLYESLMPYFPPTRKVPVLLMNGTSDARNPYYGGIGLSGFSSAINTDTAALLWASFDNCFPAPEIYEFPDLITTDLSTVTRIAYVPCQRCSEVILYRVNNGGHTWPGGIGNAPVLGNVNQDINASHEIWTFFKRHQLMCSGEDAGNDLTDLIEGLALPYGIENALSVKIENAVASCINGNEDAATNQLNAFINQVNDQRGNTLTDEEADQLIAFAQDMIGDIEDGSADCGSNLAMTIIQDDVDPIQNNLTAIDDRVTEENIQPGVKKEEKDNQNKFNLTCYPNPAATLINIGYPSLKNFSVEILNTTGEKVLRTQNMNAIDISQLQNGIYFLRVMDNQIICTKSILIQH